LGVKGLTLTAETIFQSLISVTAILFGLFAVFLAGFESARANLGKRWVPYLTLSIFTALSITIGAIGTMLAYWAASDSAVPFGLDRGFAFEVSSLMLQLLVVLEVVSMAAFGMAYLLIRIRKL